MSDTNKRRLTISMSYGLFEQLPRLNKSVFIEGLIREHFTTQNSDVFYSYVKKRLAQEGYISLPEPEKVFHPCCTRYPDLNCGHWIKSSEDDTVVNKRTGEVRELG